MTGRDERAAAGFETAARRARLTVPADWRAGAVAAYAELMALTDQLRDPTRPPGHEPSAVYRITAEDDDE
ncbi:hypothetical protein AB0L75_06085 [Streptomyces sp. NPDC052101]|uniref:hypothetical protein n=1 Tax=Streptomyces sp. NPDC052101 TaxID=3155763 RepID=UPI0034207EB8